MINHTAVKIALWMTPALIFAIWLQLLTVDYLREQYPDMPTWMIWLITGSI